MKTNHYTLKEIIHRLLKIAKEIKGYLFISTLASIIGNLSHIGFMGFGALWILSEGRGIYAFLCILCGLLIGICRYLEGVFSHLGAYGILAKMRVHLFTAIDRISPAFMIERDTGDVLNIAVNDIETLEFFFAHTIGPMFTVILLPLTSILIAWHYNPVYAWILIPAFLLISIIIPAIALKTGKRPGLRYRIELGKLKAMILESVFGLKDIQIFNAIKQRMQKVLYQNHLSNQASHMLILHRHTVSSLPNFFVYLTRILILAASGILTDPDPSGLVVVSFIATASFSSTFSLTFVVSHLLEAFASAQRIFTIEDTIPEVEERKETIPCKNIDTITFDHVSFHYPEDEHPVLDHVSLVIHKGMHIGIIGESGAGKSTFARLLMRFYDVTEGCILFNNTDIRDISLKDLHHSIGYLEQDTYLFNDTIANNIAIAKENATMEEIRDAAAKAGILSFIETLPDGFDTQMGEMQERLSGGERQRIGIARIILRDPDIIILDEPSSALDVLHEKELIEILNNAYHEKTMILISHRHSTLSGCDHIIHLEHGLLTMS